MASPIDGGVVLITGASSGIGEALARQVAHRARQLVLVARRKDRMDALATELRRENPGLATLVYACDLGDREAVLELAGEVERDTGGVDVLVNNAGLGDISLFEASDRRKLLQMLDVNVVALTLLTHAFLPGMIARKRGGVLNVSSGFGLSYAPGFAAYVGTKHYVTGFTESLYAELQGTGVRVCQLNPGPVATEFEEVAGNTTGEKIPEWLQISAEHCARAGIDGFDDERAMVIPHPAIKLSLWLAAVSPRPLVRLLMAPAGRALREKLGTKT